MALTGIRRNNVTFLSRQWFVHTVVPQKKNVVIVLDASGSMSMPVHGINSSAATPSRSMMAREAAMTVLGTLSTTDHVMTGLSTFENGNEGDLPHRKMPMREIYRSVIFRHIFATCTNISNND